MKHFQEMLGDDLLGQDPISDISDVLEELICPNTLFCDVRCHFADFIPSKVFPESVFFERGKRGPKKTVLRARAA